MRTLVGYRAFLRKNRTVVRNKELIMLIIVGCVVIAAGVLVWRELVQVLPGLPQCNEDFIDY
jgi:hypothetical protein